MNWGPPLWKEMHQYSFNYPVKPVTQDKLQAIQYYNSIVHRIPCMKCVRHYTMHLHDSPIENAVENKDILVKWVIDLHNNVNIDTGKRVWSYDEVYRLYEPSYMMFYILMIIGFLLFSRRIFARKS